MPRILSLLVVFTLAGAAQAQAKPEPLVAKVKTSIAKGVEFLVSQQRDGGDWDEVKIESKIYPGGATGMALLALLNCDGVIDSAVLEKRRLKAIDKGLTALRRLEPPPTVYVHAVQTMALAEANRPEDRKIIEANVQWLLEARVYRDGKFIGWEYHKRANASATDASNTQYAMLGLWYARQAGIEIKREVWEDIRSHFINTQHRDGWWNYSTEYGPVDKEHPSVSMTVAGLCGLHIASRELNAGREQWQPNGRFKNCGVYGDDIPLAKALHWIGKNFTVDLTARVYYNLYALERAGRLSGQRFFGEHDWYREGCEFLVQAQDPATGAFPDKGGYDRWLQVNTSFALLFLSKGRTPVVISKLVHGTWPRREGDSDWNNDRNDLRHLTEFIAKTNMFGKKPLAWQTYDIRRALEAYRNTYRVNGAEVDAAIVADMKQSPVLYITGHESLLLPDRFSDLENTLIKRYVENGGFIFAEACCGSAEFDKGFKAWVKNLWDQDLTYLESTHPVWTCEYVIKAGQPYKLMGLQIGCRTVMVYSEQDLSCHWESNRLDDAKAQAAFRLGANIVAYGTGRTPPQPRLTQVEIASDPSKMKEGPTRGAFQVRQIRFGNDWQPAPKAMSNLLQHVYEVTGLDVTLKTEPIRLGFSKDDVRKSKFFYMHGRSDFRIDADLEPLRFSLENGGLLFADACCGNAAFDKSFRKFVQQIFPSEKLVRVPVDGKDRDLLFGPQLNEEPLTAANIKCRTKANGPMEAMAPYLEGIKIDGRWVVLYSRYDIGCALEQHTSPDCIGYAPDSALRIATAVVRYNVQP